MASIQIGLRPGSKTRFAAFSLMQDPDLIELFVKPLNDLGWICFTGVGFSFNLGSFPHPIVGDSLG